MAWYRLFGRDAAGSNIRVRLNDYHIKGCGDEIPATSFCQFRIQNLTTHKRYVFAVSAYTAEGKLIGGTIGETSKPVLASHPLPVQMAWAYLSQVNIHTECKSGMCTTTRCRKKPSEQIMVNR